MKTSPLHLHELAESVLAVPPLARQEDLSIAEAPNRCLIKHIEAGGIRTLLYGGNANLYHMPLREYQALLDLLADAAGPQTRVIPSVGPDFGKMIEQAPMLRDSGYQTAMVLPMQGLSTSEGVAEGIARFVDIAGIPVTLYIKSEQYIDLDRLERLVADGLVLCVKYAILRSDPDTDPFCRPCSSGFQPSAWSAAWASARFYRMWGGLAWRLSPPALAASRQTPAAPCCAPCRAQTWRAPSRCTLASCRWRPCATRCR